MLTTAPMVPYRVQLQGQDKALDLESPLDFPVTERPESIQEPTVNATIITPEIYIGKVLDLCSTRRGNLIVRPLLVFCDFSWGSRSVLFWSCSRRFCVSARQIWTARSGPRATPDMYFPCSNRVVASLGVASVCASLLNGPHLRATEVVHADQLVRH